jgi:hypothetical protein
VAVADDPSAVLLIRVWREGEDGAFRARLSGMSISGEPAASERTVAVAASSRDVLVAVEQWLADFLKGGETGA